LFGISKELPYLRIMVNPIEKEQVVNAVYAPSEAVQALQLLALT
jgi:hypothetical protein